MAARFNAVILLNESAQRGLKRSLADSGQQHQALGGAYCTLALTFG